LAAERRHGGRCTGNLYRDGTYYSDPGGLIQAGGTDLDNVGLAPANALLRFGLYSGGGTQYFDGGLDEVSIYNRVLTIDEMQSHRDLMVPEPATISLVILGGLFLLGARWRRKEP